MVVAESGEDEMLWCEEDGYAANLEMATSQLAPLPDRQDIGDDVEEFATPGITTIEQLAEFPGGARAEHQIKTLVYFADDKPALALLRGDHQLNEVKLAGALSVGEVRAGREDEIVALLGARPGSLGAVNVQGKTVVCDEALRGRTRMTTGANRDGFHLRGVSVERDIATSQNDFRWADLRLAQPDEMSPRGGGPLQISRCIELGHVFKLGNKYTKAMNAKFLDESGQERIIEMGCYGLGVSRVLAALAETHHDERGIIWPEAVAPFDAQLLLLDKDEELVQIAEKLYADLRAAGIDTLFDDRNERPGSKFADADLFGIPHQIVVGKTTRESGEVEVRLRADKSSVKVPVAEAVEHLTQVAPATS